MEQQRLGLQTGFLLNIQNELYKIVHTDPLSIVIIQNNCKLTVFSNKC